MLLIGLMMPLMMRVIDISMFRVALPTIRQDFGIPADVTAWLDTVYTVPFIIFMPLYGRLGDGVEKFQLFLTGITVFLIGTVVTLSAIDLRFLIVGRILQGMGAAEIHPLSLSIISERIPLEKRGSALGTWSSSGALIGMVGPLGGGILIALWGWRMIFGPVLLIGGIALLVVQKQARSIPQKVIQKSFLRTFDWGGVLLLSTSTIVLVFYASSRPSSWRCFCLGDSLFRKCAIRTLL
jgi:MFS family permease